jgi:hypothetical protein
MKRVGNLHQWTRKGALFTILGSDAAKIPTFDLI